MGNSRRFAGSLYVIFTAMAAILLFAGRADANGLGAQISSFEGLATDPAGHRLPDGTITLTMRYYSLASGGTLYYAEQFLNVPIRSGLFTIQMGTGGVISGGSAALFADAVRANTSMYAEPAINSDPPMAPRILITYAPYAIHANMTDYLGSLSASQYLDTTSTAQTKTGPLTLTGSVSGGYGVLTSMATGGGTAVLGTGFIGVTGFTNAGGGGVYGRVSGTFLPYSYGVAGTNDGPYGMGVSGLVNGNGASTPSNAVGVYGAVGSPYLYRTYNYSAGVRGESAVGDGVQGASTRSNGVYGYGNNVGVMGEAHYDSTLSYMFPFGVWGKADGGGTGVVGDSDVGGGVLGRGASGPGVMGRSETGIGVYGMSAGGSGPSTAVQGDTGSGIGVRGNANAAGGTGVMASGHGTSSTALLIDNGPIKVSGAAPTAFVVIAPTYASQTWFAIDNPNCNNDPNAMLIVTANTNPDGRTEIVYDPHPIAVFYDTTRAKWEITNADGVGMPTHAAFNVLVIKK